MNSVILLLCVFLYFVLIIVFSLFKKTSEGIDNPYLNLIKPFIPSWKFYDDFEETRLLFYRAKATEEEAFSEWAPLYQNPKASFATLFINQGNLVLAAQSHIQQLLHDIEVHDESKPFEETVTYKITKNLVSYAIRKKYPVKFTYQFKLASVDLLAHPKEDILLSPIYVEGETNE
ncbi:MAG: hypothetical protein K2Q18_12205 [Bdellovibrionales bacterium]|nr:hypothetical protein [Bdellovibrionales bacterium]